MRKFRFNKSAADQPLSPDSPVQIPDWFPDTEEGPKNNTVSFDQWVANEAHRKGVEEFVAKQRKNRAERRRISQPYGVYSFDDDLNPIIDIYHQSQQQWKNNLDARGRLKVNEQRRYLEHPDSGYESTVIPLESYVHKPEFVKLAPNGLTVFRRKTTNGTRLTTAVDKAQKIVDQARATEMLRSSTGGAKVVDELDPEHPLNILQAFGPEAVYSRIFTDNRMPMAAAAPSGEDSAAEQERMARTKLCICDHAEEHHVSAKEAADRPDETLQIHEFTPQYVIDAATGRAVPGSTVRANQSILRHALLTPNRSDNPSKVEPKVVRADKGMGSAYMPIARIGLTGSRVTKVYIRPTGKDKYGNDIAAVVAEKPNTSAFKTCPGDKARGIKCFGGKLNPRRTISSIECQDDMKGNPIYSQDGSRQIAVGLGGGKIRILNQEDCPTCKDCKGSLGHWQNNKSGNTWIPCTTCHDGEKSTGKDLSALESTQCGNCPSENSSIPLTDNNLCRICGGTGRVNERYREGDRVLPRPQTEVYREEQRLFEGVPVTFETFDSSGWGDSHIDGYGPPKADCKICHGDTEYQDANTGLPCKCSIGSFSSGELIAPKDFRGVTPNGINCPLFLYQAALKKHFEGRKGSNPHTLITDWDFVDPLTNLPRNETAPDGRPSLTYSAQDTGLALSADGESRVNVEDRSIPASRYLGMYMPGNSFTPEEVEQLTQRSIKHRQSRNAKYRAGSMELHDIAEVLEKRFASMPINIPGVNIAAPTVKKKVDGTMDATTMHPRVQQAASDIESKLPNIGVDPSTLSDTLPKVLESASRVEHARDSGAPEDEHFDNYQRSLNDLLDDTIRRHGRETADKLPELLQGLPSSPIISTPVPKTEDIS